MKFSEQPPLGGHLPTPSLESTGRPAHKEYTQGRENWPKLLQDATCEVFSAMLNSEATVAPPGTQVTTSEFTAMVGLAGKLRGVCILRCSSKAANRMASRMLGIDPLETTDDAFDAFGEICNMVAGNFKNKLTGISEHCLLSCPTVISGSDYQCPTPSSVESTHHTLLFEGNPLGIVLQIHR